MIRLVPNSDFLYMAMRRAACGIMAFIAVMAIFVAAPAIAGQISLNDSERRFIWDEASSIIMSARKPDDFIKAYNAYRKLDEAGVRNGFLYYNMGTCLLKAKEFDSASKMLERSERYLGNRRDVRNNMTIALSAMNKGQGNQIMPWSRFLMFWHYNLPGSIRLTLAVFGFSGIWLALALRIFGLKALSHNLTVISAVLLVLFGSSAITTMHQESKSERITISKPDTELINGIRGDSDK